MAATGMPSNAVFPESSSLPTPKPKLNGFTRAHSLEIPDINTNVDVTMVDCDEEAQATSEFLDVCITDKFWHEATNTPTPTQEHKLFHSPPVEDATFAKGAIIEDTSRKPKQTKRVSAKKKIETLRAEVNVLTAHLNALGTSLRSQETLAKPPHAQNLWKHIASRQFEQRQKSEEENVKLREMMGIQVQEARNLKRVLKRRAKIEMMENMLDEKLHATDIHLNSSAVPNTTLEFEHMLRDISGLHSRMDSLFSEHGMDRIPCPGQKRRSVKDALNGVRLELAERRFMLHNSKAIETAVWNALCQMELHSLQCVDGFTADMESHTEYADQHATTALIRYVAAYSGGYSGISGINVRKVVRRYTEGHRSVLIYRSLMEPQPSASFEPVGIHAVATLMVEVRHDSVAVLNDGRTLVQSYFYVTQHDEGLPAGQRFRLPDNLDIGLAAWDEFISRIYRNAESFSG